MHADKVKYVIKKVCAIIQVFIVINNLICKKFWEVFKDKTNKNITDNEPDWLPLPDSNGGPAD